MKQRPVHSALQFFLEGKVLLIDKPLGWTSFDAVKKVRTLTGVAKVGHAGTLDPLASGLLILCTGKLTKKIPEIQDAEKEYTGTMVLGAITASYDLETEVVEHKDFSSITEDQVMQTVQKFTGELLQSPPSHSAVKIGGRRAYDLARKGEEVQTKPKPVLIKEFEITRIAFPEVDFRVICSKGTYIRSLAHDFGKELGCGAYLKGLCRTRIGEYELINAIDPQQFSRVDVK